MIEKEGGRWVTINGQHILVGGPSMHVYHGSSSRAAGDIKQNGLKAGKGGYTYVTTDKQVAHFFGFSQGKQGGNYALVELRVPRGTQMSSYDPEMASSYRIKGDIPPGWVVKVTTHSKSEGAARWHP